MALPHLSYYCKDAERQRCHPQEPAHTVPPSSSIYPHVVLHLP